jgi:hypothetical protein
MNTWGKRPYVSLPETGSFEELTVKRLKFGDCPVSLPTNCPPINGSALAFDTNGIGTWSSGPPAAVQDRIQDAANTCSVVCSAAGDVTMTGAGGENVKCFGNEISLENGQTQIVLFQYGVTMGGPDGELFYTDSTTTRMKGPGGAAEVALKGNEVEIIAPGLQLLLPNSAADKVLTCLDDTGVSEWREPAIPVQIQDALNSNSAVECDVDNIYIEPGTDLMINLPSGNGADKVLTCVDDDGFVEWLDPAIPNRIQDPGDTSSRVWCDSDNIYIQPGIGLQLDLDSNVPGKVLTCIDVNGTAGWQDPAPAAIPSRIQDLGGAVVECVTGNVAISTPASGQVTIGASAVATSKITLESAALQVSIPSVGINNVLTSIDAVGNAEWRPIPAVTAPDRIRNAAGTVEVLCSSSDLFVMAGPTFPGYVLTSTATSGICQWQSVLGISVTLGGLANQSTLRNTLQINGNMGTTISNNNNGPGACYITPRPMTLVAIQYDLVSSTTSTVFTIYRNTAVIGTFSPSVGSPLRGNQPFVPVVGGSGSMSQGAFVSVKWTAGTQPNGSLVTLYFT